ncbi:hypothetical protein CHL67_06415 [Prosthecochloris sp. GSB1]|nr:hypothetical protein CHL67_06415 [Prosthecochloris sp. GSB1]
MAEVWIIAQPFPIFAMTVGSNDLQPSLSLNLFKSAFGSLFRSNSSFLDYPEYNMVSSRENLIFSLNSHSSFMKAFNKFITEQLDRNAFDSEK